MKTIPTLLKDGYKVGHIFQYPEDTTYIYSNLTPRRGRRSDCGEVIWFGLQYFIYEYLIRAFNEDFFSRPQHEVMSTYERRIHSYLGKIDCRHIGELHNLGYLPLRIKALPEGTLVPYGVPVMTVMNTHDKFYWLTNMIETMMSCVIWKGSTSATTAFQYRRMFDRFAHRTGASKDRVRLQGHDFSFRGMSSVEDASLSGAGHLLSFTGTDTIPAIDFLEQYYSADCETEIIGTSIPATEHSVMSMGEPESELNTITRLVTDVYPKGPISIVSDTWDLWRVLTEYLPMIKHAILDRDGTLVIRPDSGDPVKIVCGDPGAYPGTPQYAGVAQLLYETFGGTKNSAGYIELDSHIGVIYGESITLERQKAILQGLADKGFSSSSITLGIGSYTYQYVSRDTDGWAMKSTAGWTRSRGLIPIFKDPVTDDGTKKSARGLLCVTRSQGLLTLEQNVSEEREKDGELLPCFEDGHILRTQTLREIRNLIETQLSHDHT